jgi:hypothetical protein
LTRIFWIPIPHFNQKKSKKIRVNPPDPPNPFSHSIPFSKAEITVLYKIF